MSEGERQADRGDLVALLLLLALGLFAFLPGLDGGWVWDDFDAVAGNPHLELPASEMLTRPYVAGRGYWRPLASLTLARDLSGGGGDPTRPHVVNLALHLVGAAVLFLALERLLPGRRETAFAAAALFAVHPAQPEVVTWVVGRADALVLLLGVGCAAAAAAFGTTGRRGWLALSWGLLGLALLSKESAVTLLVLAPLAHGASSGREHPKRLAAWLAGALVIAGLWFAARHQVLGADSLTSSADIARTGRTGPARALMITGRYLEKTLWPRRLLPAYGREEVPAGGLSSSHGLRLGALVLCVMLGLGLAARREPLVGLAGLWFLVALLPVTHLLVALPFSVAARGLSLPLPGAALLAALGLERIRSPSARRLLLLLLLVGFTLETRSNARMWRDDVGLWEECLARSGGAGLDRIRLELGLAHLRREEFAPALRWFTDLERDSPSIWQLQVKIARAEIGLGRLDAAEARLTRALGDPATRELARANLDWLRAVRAQLRVPGS